MNVNVDEAIRRLKDPNPLVRREAATLLGKTKDARVVEPLITALKDHDKEVRVAAASALARDLGDQRGVEAVAGVLRHGDPGMRALLSVGGGVPTRGFFPRRREAARALALSGNAHALDVLIAVLNERDVWNRIIVAEALALTDDRRAVNALIAVLRSEPKPGVFSPWTSKGRPWLREEVAHSLAVIGGPDATAALVEYLGSLSGADWSPRPEVFGAVWKARHMPGVEEALVRCLQRANNSTQPSKPYIPLAELFLNSGDDGLYRMASDWATGNGYKVVRVLSGTTGWTLRTTGRQTSDRPSERKSKP
ncbi:MAG: HEAT repeat domain-containing protein [Bryobacteraceae bacterium]